MARNVDLKLGKAIGARRRELGLSPDALAERTGTDAEGRPRVSARTINNVEGKGELPNLANLRALASALETTVGELLGEQTSAVEEEIPGWQALPPEHRRVVRELVEAYAAQHGGVERGVERAEQLAAEVSERMTGREERPPERRRGRPGASGGA